MSRTPIPEQFMKMMVGLDRQEFDALPAALDAEPEVGVRLNMRKAFRITSGAQSVAWCPVGLHLTERPSFTFDPLLHQGAYYVQDPSSMITWHLARMIADEFGRPVAWLDACAAPGGKTTAAIDALRDGSAVVANEYVGTRADILRENLAKWGYPLVTVTQCDTSRFAGMGETFDVIAADVPCSGEGMMRKDDEARRQWTLHLTEQCAALQREIVSNLWPALRPGGYLIYSTCTLNTTENEKNVAHFINTLGADNPEIPIPEGCGIMPSLSSGVAALRFTPGCTRGEGLFMALLRKPAGTPYDAPVARPQRRRDKPTSATPVPHPWLNSATQVIEHTDQRGNVTVTIPTPLLPRELSPTLTIGVRKGHDIIPSQQLALSNALRQGVFPTADVDRQTALKYLRRETIVLPDVTPRGIVLLQYAGLPLGFVKNLGNRANNLYPASWRILSQLPDPLPPLPLSE